MQRKLCIFDTPVSELAEEFNLRGRLKGVEVPKALYHEFLRLYRNSQKLHDKLILVLEDGEHRLVMEEGRGRFDLPPDDYLTDDLNELAGLLKSFDPYRVESAKGKEKVFLTARQIQGFFSLFAKDCDIYHSVFEALRDTEYLKYHRHLRDVDHVKYAGPTSLQEVVDVYIGVARAHNKQRAYLLELSAAPR